MGGQDDVINSGGSSAAEASPRSLLSKVRILLPVSAPVMVTVAPGTTAPVGSVTVMAISPSDVCANTGQKPGAARIAAASTQIVIDVNGRNESIGLNL